MPVMMLGYIIRGNWHGDVAIKMLNMDSQDSDAPTDNSAQLQQFKMEVSHLFFINMLLSV